MIGNGCVIAIGGNEDKSGCPASILNDFVERAGGVAARVVIVPFASEEPVKRAAMYTELFRSFGARDVRTLQVAGDDDCCDYSLLDNATGIFATGGDQERLMLLLNRGSYVEAIRRAVMRGAVYAGTSAGAAAISEEMIFAVNDADARLSYGKGLGLTPRLIIDQHFSERQRLPRLKAAVSEKNLVGVGVDENTAVIFEPAAQRLTIKGSGTVTIVTPNDHSDEHDSVQLGHGTVVELL